ncbi:MAG: hypothetical protein HN368_05725 [Spirochaetales bacterium]|jgi:hypothetical protein|nr:hypothetical protein [Spirochaetales bacterium]
MAISENRKVFFLHPQAVIQDELVRALIEANYEAYLLRNAADAKTVLKEYPNALLFLQIDSGMEEEAWLAYIDDLKSTPSTQDLTIAIVSVQPDETIQSTFLENSDNISHGISYGSYNYERTYKQIDNILSDEKTRVPKNIARGTFSETPRVSLHFARNDNRYEGVLRDITISGVTCRLIQDETFPSNLPIPAIIISYGKKQLTVSGTIAGSHGESEKIHLILFNDDCKKTQASEIYDLIQVGMQREIEDLIAAKGHKRQVVTKIPRSQLYGRK